MTKKWQRKQQHQLMSKRTYRHVLVFYFLILLDLLKLLQIIMYGTSDHENKNEMKHDGSVTNLMRGV